MGRKRPTPKISGKISFWNPFREKYYQSNEKGRTRIDHPGACAARSRVPPIDCFATAHFFLLALETRSVAAADSTVARMSKRDSDFRFCQYTLLV